MAYRGGYKGLAASYKHRAKTAATRGIYNFLGGSNTDKKISRKNPTTRNAVHLMSPTGSVNRAKRIIQLDENGKTVKIYQSAQDIENSTNREYKAAGVQKACRERKKYKGYYWSYE